MLCIVHRRVINLWHIRWWWPIVCFSFLFILFLFLTTCASLSWPHSAFVSTLNSSVVSYRIVSGMEEQKLLAYNAQCVYTVWVKKIPPSLQFSDIFPNGWEFLINFYTPIVRSLILSTLDYKFLSNYLQLWRSYAIPSATTQRIFTFH